jgi:hypothetical protein
MTSMLFYVGIAFLLLALCPAEAAHLVKRAKASRPSTTASPWITTEVGVLNEEPVFQAIDSEENAAGAMPGWALLLVLV